MDGETEEALLLRDDNGQYYLIPRDLLEGCRVAAQDLAQLAQQATGDEVRGYLLDGTGPSPASTFTTIGFASAPRDVATGQASGKRQWGPVHLLGGLDGMGPSLLGDLTK
jgi:hypothetical protein